MTVKHNSSGKENRLGELLRKQKQMTGLVIISFVLAFTIIVLTIQQNLPRYGFSINDFKIDQPAPADFIVQRDNISFQDESATNERREASARRIPPIFVYNNEKATSSLDKFASFHLIILEGIENHSTPKQLYTTLQFDFPQIIKLFTVNEIDAIIKLFPNQTEVFNIAEKLLSEVMVKGLFEDIEVMKNQAPDRFIWVEVELLRDNQVVGEILSMNAITQYPQLRSWIEEKMETVALDEVNKSLIRLFIMAFAQENCFFDNELTSTRQEQARNRIPPISFALEKNTPLVRKDTIVTPRIMAQIIAHGESDFSLNINILVQTALYLLILFTLAFFLFSRNIIRIKLKFNQVVLICGTGLFLLLLTSGLTWIPWDSSWLPLAVLLPCSTLTIIITIIISPSVGIIFSLLCALLILMVTNMNLNSFLFAFLTGAGGSFVAFKAERRIDLIRSGFILSLFNIIILLMLGFMHNFPLQQSLLAAGWGLINGSICGVLSIGLLPVVEYLLNAATRFRLMELSDLNSPIFKKMLTVAPGTYNHSVFIANLAESVCIEIGANPLLARVGAYYHDIGKIDQAEYFIENQRDSNKHDELRPTLSAAIIKSHVKIGIEKAKDLRLPVEVVDIIAQHHGKGLIAYFYQMAINENKSGKVPPSDFSYTTSRPCTKEAAVVMLADVVEAASRTLRKPTMAKLEKFIWSIIMDRFSSGELSESNLTLTDLEIIKNKFVQLMAGHFHSRIEYPKKKEGNK